jgi:hypothetical protein
LWTSKKEGVKTTDALEMKGKVMTVTDAYNQSGILENYHSNTMKFPSDAIEKLADHPDVEYHSKTPKQSRNNIQSM